MSKLAKLQELKSKLAAYEAEAESLAKDPKILRAQECLDMLNSIKQEYGMSLDELVAIARPGAVIVVGGSASPAPKTRRARRTKVYKNPHSQEVLRTKGGNNNTLKSWRERWGTAVDDWWKYED